MRIALCGDCTKDALFLKKYPAGHGASVYSDADSLLEDIENKLLDRDHEKKLILEHQVCADIFMRCHQSFIFNMYHVKEVSGTGLIIAGALMLLNGSGLAAPGRGRMGKLFLPM